MEITATCDEREEGEIIEDDLEDVSDSSMLPGSPLDSGKSVSPPELLSAVCLSSVSSSDYSKPCGRKYYDEPFQTHNKRQWRHRRKRKIDYDLKRRNHVRHRKRVSIETHSDSDNDLVDPKYAKQLKDALKRESPQELHNSLRTRLKGFFEPTSEEENSLTALRDMALLSTKNADVDTVAPSEGEGNELKHSKDLVIENFEDSELFELRMAALKSVVMEKHERRKRKTKECANSPNDKQESSDIDKENDQSVINNDIDIKASCDHAVEAGALLKQDVVDSKNDEDNVMEDDVDILRAMLLANMSETLATKVEKLTTNNSTKTAEDNQKRTSHQSYIPNHVIVKPLIINVNGDSDSDTDFFQNETEQSLKETVTQFLKKQRAEVEKNVKKKETTDSSLNKSDDTLMDKSVMRLLPRSQQIEYRQLKQRLLNARKKTRIRRQSQRISESKRDLTQSIKKVPKVKVVEPAGSSNSSVNGKVVKSVQERSKMTQPANNLQRTLNDLQIRKNGRLQMKGKYRPLGVLLHRINHASNIRRQHELEIKKLLHEIQKARIKLATSHQNFTNLVQQLVKDKQVIDQRTYKISKTPAVVPPITSTPKKTIPRQENANDVSKTETGNQEKELLEPNDVTKIFDAQLDALPKYISPLDNRDGNGIGNALMTFCPYDVLGTCKDKECQYVHFT